jgi:hypothetical protein
MRERNDDEFVDFEAEMELSEDIGAEAILHFTSGHVSLCSVMRYGDAVRITGEAQKLAVHRDNIVLFDPVTKRVLEKTGDE